MAVCLTLLAGCAAMLGDQQPPARQAAPITTHYDAGRVITEQRLEPGLEAGLFEAFQAARQRCQDHGYRGAREGGPSETRCTSDEIPCESYLIQRQFECTGGFRPVLDRRNI